MLRCKAQNECAAIDLGWYAEGGHLERRVSGRAVLGTGLKNEEGSLFGEGCCRGMPKMLAGWSLV